MSKMAELANECNKICENCQADNMKLCRDCVMTITMGNLKVKVDGETRKILSIEDNKGE